MFRCTIMLVLLCRQVCRRVLISAAAFYYQSSNLVDRTAAARQMHTTCLVVTRKVHSILPFNFLAESQFASNFYRERQK